MVCIIRGGLSAVPKRWVGMIPILGESCLSLLVGRRVLDQVIDRARPQISSLVLCHAGDPSPFARYDLPIVAPKTKGLLAAILAGLDWTAAHSRETPWVATFAADTPDFPTDLVESLGQAVGAEGADMAWGVRGGRTVPVFGLWPVRLRRALNRTLEKRPELAVDEWAASFRPARVAFSPATAPFAAVHGPENSTSGEPYITSGGARPTAR